MSSMQINAFFSDDDIQYILNLPEVNDSKDRLLQTNGYIVHTKKQQNHNNVVAFTIPNTSSITETIRLKWNIDLDNVQNIPMRWIKGDTASHIDTPLFKLKTKFDNTYLVYLNNSLGEFVIGDTTNNIQQNTGFKFSEGVYHKTQNTGNEPRLLLGPMNENGILVGRYTVNYYLNLDDANNNINEIARSDGFTVGNFSIVDVSGSMDEFTQWKIASAESFDDITPSPSNIVYNNGDILNGTPGNAYYDLYYFPTTNEPPVVPKPFGLVPTPQFTLTVPNRIYMKNLFSNNANVFYKPGTLSAGGIGTVKNTRHKSTHT